MPQEFIRKFKQDPAVTTSMITVALVIVIVFAKSAAVWASGSAAVLSALIDSLSDIGLSVMTLISVQWSLKPADDNHRHGHGKIEGIAALIQGSLLLGGGAFLVMEALSRFLKPVTVTDHLFTLFLMALATVLSLVIAKVQKIGAAHTDSLAVEADSLHYSADVYINGSVFLIVLIDYFGIVGRWLDPLCAILVAGIMARAAYQIATKAFSMLLDEELSEDIRSKIIAKIRTHPEVISFHDLRTSQSGRQIFISFDIEVDANLLLWSAHEIGQAIEKSLLEDFPTAEIMIHIDPAGLIEDSRHRHLGATNP